MQTTAQCCWCQRTLVLVAGSWWCSNQPCAERQAKYATVTRNGETGPIQQYLYVPTPRQVEWHDATYNPKIRRLLAGGAAGPGKSRWVRETLYLFAQQVPGFHGLLLRRTSKDLEQSHVRFMPYEAKQRGATFRAGPPAVVSFGHAHAPDSVIRCGHLEDDSAIQNYLSSEYDIIAPDELVTFNRDVMLELFTRARSTNRALMDLRGDPAHDYDGALVLSASNPGGKGGLWVKDFFIDRCPDADEFPDYDPSHWAFCPAFLRDNPYLRVGGYEQSLSALRDSRKRQLLDGDWTVFEGQFFDNFKASRHVQDLGPLSPDYTRFLSLDWGLGSPGCCLWWVCLPDGHYHIEREFKFNGEVGAKRYVKDVAEEIVRACHELGLARVPLCWVDPDITLNKGQIGESIAETFGRHGVPCIKSTNDRVNGWQRCYEMLRNSPDGTPWLTIDPSCRYLIRTIPIQMQNPSNPEDVNTLGDDHGVDAWRYGAMSRPMFAPKRRHEPEVAFSAGWWRKQSTDRRTGLLGSESLSH